MTLKSRIITIIATLLCNISHADITSGLVGYWNFSNPSDLGYDSSGFGNHGIVTTSDVTYTDNGRLGGAAKFVEGISNSAIKIPYNSSLMSNNSLTLAAWVNLDGIDPDFGNAIFSKECSNKLYDDYNLWVNSHGGGYLVGVSAWLGSEHNINGVYNALPNNTWKHVALTYDGKNIKIYVDSILNATTIAPSVATDYGCDILIGQSPIGGAEDFSGLMDELRIYNRALFAQEITELYEGANNQSSTVKGTVIWARPSYSVKCTNNTTSESILLPRNKKSSYDCEKSGLVINSGDNVTVTINGNKK